MLLGIGSFLRAIAVGLAGGTPLLVLLALGTPSGVAAHLVRGPGFGAWLVTGAVAALWLAAAWWAVIALAVCVEVGTRGRVPGTRLAGCPRGLRRWLLACCGAAILAGVATPSYAAGAGHAPDLPVPERPVGAVGHPDPSVRPGHRPPPDLDRVLVRPGDSLWRIAARVAPDTDAAGLVRLTDRLYRLNRTVIGADPDLIRPGTTLRLPPRQHHPAKETRS